MLSAEGVPTRRRIFGLVRPLKLPALFHPAWVWKSAADFPRLGMADERPLDNRPATSLRRGQYPKHHIPEASCKLNLAGRKGLRPAGSYQPGQLDQFRAGYGFCAMLYRQPALCGRKIVVRKARGVLEILRF